MVLALTHLVEAEAEVEYTHEALYVFSVSGIAGDAN